MRKRKADHSAATRGGGWTGLPHCVQDSNAFKSLSLYARVILLEIIRKFNGYNNGEIALSQRELGHRIQSTNYRKIGAATAELMEKGLIDVRTNGVWKARMAREFRLTFVSTGSFHRPVAATNDYLNWSEGNSDADHASANSDHSDDNASASGQKTDDIASSTISEKWRKTFKSRR